MLHVEHISVSLGGRSILEDVSFEAHAGEFIAILGPNGGGKSTLIRALLGLVPLHAGRVSITPSSTFIGYVPQVKTLDRSFPATAADLVVTGRRARWPWRVSVGDRDIVRRALERVGAGHLEHSSLSRLSGGELQRVYLARALACRPPLILLDEPEAGVDRVGAADLFDILESYRHEHGATIVMVTHDWDVAFHHASGVVLLNRSVVASGSPVEALTEEAIKEAFGHVGHAHGVLGGHHHG